MKGCFGRGLCYSMFKLTWRSYHYYCFCYLSIFFLSFATCALLICIGVLGSVRWRGANKCREGDTDKKRQRLGYDGWGGQVRGGQVG